MARPTHKRIVALLGLRAYGRVMSNLTRPIYVEGMVALLLGDGWRYLGDWDGWDLERDDGWRVEVKQSAARQPWTDREGRDGRETIASFDIDLAPGIGLMALRVGFARRDGMRICSCSRIIRCWTRRNAISATSGSGYFMFSGQSYYRRRRRG